MVRMANTALGDEAMTKTLRSTLGASLLIGGLMLGGGAVFLSAQGVRALEAPSAGPAPIVPSDMRQPSPSNCDTMPFGCEIGRQAV